MNAIALEPKQVPAHLKGTYAGKSFRAVVCEQVTIPMTAGLWHGESRETYRLVRLSDGKELPVNDDNAAPWDRSRKETIVKLEPGFAIVEHSHFCGKDMGLRFYLHPSNATAFLPATVELTPLESMVLDATASLKSSYMGKDRYEMTVENLRWQKDASIPSRTQWDEAKASLIERGLLNKAGAITVAGRNARNARKG
ncbi:MAG: hypothetical protein KGJ90_00075 [Patescibacteria group bacterium]|nr:hypothetical protein [Patescibacteria group bacterium]